MPHRAVLSSSQRQTFEALPAEPESLARHYTLTEDDLSLIRDRRLAHNRLGFAVQLCLIRYPGRALRVNEELPQPLIKFVAEQTGDRPNDFVGYATRDKTRREHLSFLVHHFQLSTFKQHHFKEVARWLVPFRTYGREASMTQTSRLMEASLP
jgi:TnpA family transposase